MGRICRSGHHALRLDKQDKIKIMRKIKTTPKKLVLVNFILDKSGSMSTVKSATISGFNEYIQNLRNDKKVDYKLTLTLFDTKVEKLYDAKPLKDIKNLTEDTYGPSGMTALYDAACHAIKEVKNEKNYKRVITVIMTDGEENSSVEYTEETFKKLIDEKRDWTFAFLGANQDSYAKAQRYGIHGTQAMNFTASSIGVGNAINTLSAFTYAAAMSSKTSGLLSKANNVHVTVNI